jgi:proline dehydrogenase
MVRGMLLSVSKNRWLAEQASRAPFVRRAVARFLPGEDADSAIAAARHLHASGIGAVLTRLGENLGDADAIDEVVAHYLRLLHDLRDSGIGAHLSVKPTQLGLDLGIDACHASLERIARGAEEFGTMLLLDMESSEYTDATLELFRRLRRDHANVGLCLQANLRRTAGDLAALLPLGPYVRLVKGAYKESRSRAFQRKKEIDASFLRLAAALLAARAAAVPVTPIFATHDLPLILRIVEEAGRRGVPPESLEVQFLYGIRPANQVRLAAAGCRVRLLISYGPAWFPWYMRRLAERPANLLLVVRSLFA